MSVVDFAEMLRDMINDKIKECKDVHESHSRIYTDVGINDSNTDVGMGSRTNTGFSDQYRKEKDTKSQMINHQHYEVMASPK